MNTIYRALGMSKQAFHQKMDRVFKVRSEEQQLLIIIYQLRKDHPTMGIRDMYFKLSPVNIGRDAFEDFCRTNSLGSMRTKNKRRTTDSSGVIRFDNLFKELIIKSINQAWQSDITYFEVSGRFYYLTFIIDSFSRKIIGHSVSARLITEDTTLPALCMAIKNRKKQSLSIHGVVLHSDGGGQYYDKEFLKITHNEGILNSMCEFAWENGIAERLNGVIKNNYLMHRKIETYSQLKQEVDRTVLLYNFEKPHIELGRKTPVEYEKQYICKGQQSDDEKSATELNPQPEKRSAFQAEDNNPSESNIALELKI